MPQGPMLKNMDDGSQKDSGTASSKIGGDARGGAIEAGTASPIQRSYPGGKNGSGAYQRLINWIPPHDVYVEPFLGGGAIMIHKRPALVSYGIDIYDRVCDTWEDWVYEPTENEDEGRNIFNQDAVEFLKFHDELIIPETFIFCDPPYIRETRSSPSRIYKYEYAKKQHIELLKLLVSLKAMIMITGYRHPIYDDALSSWRRKDYKTTTRGGLKDESCWMNYPEPTELHDYQYLGSTFKKREQIKLKQQRLLKRLNNMPDLERKAMMEVLNSGF